MRTVFHDIMGLLLSLILLTTSFVLIVTRHRQTRAKAFGKQQLPPAPLRLPVVGNILQLGWAAHVSFAKLANKHGPIMSLWLGSVRTIVISSNLAAREMFINHDKELAGRTTYEAMRGDHGSEGSMITAQYGPRWRLLRRLATTEFFVTNRLNETQELRKKCIDQMLIFITQEGEFGTKAIDVGKFFYLMAFNLIGNLMFSKDLLDPKSSNGANFFHHAAMVMELAGKPNVSDFLPMLRWLDPQGLRRKLQFHINKAFDISTEFIKERMESKEIYTSQERKRKDYLNVLLEYRGDVEEGSAKFSSYTIATIIFEMFVAGTDTTTSTLEWAMAELLRNPIVLEKAKSELRSKIGPGKKVEEKDLEILPYLKAVIKETLRLHPPLPFLVPHKAMESCNMLGYHIPKEAQNLVNVWAIGRDPKTWHDPLEFKPERFLEPNVGDYKGRHFEFLPFGSGRRMCPALPLSSRVLPLALGSALHSFDWFLADNLNAEDLEMSERIGITLRKAVSLKAIAVPCTSGED